MGRVAKLVSASAGSAGPIDATALLRFVPYIGPLIAMALPLLLAFAIDQGWSLLLMTALND